MDVKVTVDARKDGKYSATIKLIGWDRNKLWGFIRNISLSPFGRRIAREAGLALTEAESPKGVDAKLT